MDKVIRSGIVIVTPQNNPSIMTQQFLREYKIADSKWVLKSMIESPQFSQVFWENGLSITSETGKIIFQYDFQEKGPKPYEKNCLLGKIAENYANQLSKVKYTGVGINFSSFYDELDNIREEFIKNFKSPILSKIDNTAQKQVKIIRKIDEFKTQNLTTSLAQFAEPGKKIESDKSPFCLSFNGNFDIQISKSKIHDSWVELIDILKSWDSYYTHYSKLVNEIIYSIKAGK